ncbi:MAG: hypothetical protein AAF738_07155, partial [Bacteroidota bacterium]
MNKLLSSFLLVCLNSMLLAQHFDIPVQEMASLERRLKRNKQLAQESVFPRWNIQYVPITFHLTAKDDGTQRVSERAILDQLCSLNEDFAPLNIQFYIHRLHYINSSVLFDNHRQGQTQMENERDRFSIDVFIFENANTDSGIEEGITFGYYSPSRDWVVMRKDQISGRSVVLTHELGHFFSLLHPYNGWDNEPWEEAVHGNPAPRLSPRGIRTEQQNGGNCDNAGDFLCDTPPDYFFAFGWRNCTYNGGAQDPNGELVDPDESLFMANFLQGCSRSDYNFSPQQQSMMQTDLQTDQRAYLRTGFQPTDLAATSTTAITPSSGVNIPTHNLVSFNWTPISGATQYLVEIDRLPTFALQATSIVTDKNFLEVNTLLPNTRYYWRVRPFNAQSTCTSFTLPSAFTTGNMVADLDGGLLEDWAIFPNPSRVANALQIELTTNRSFEAKLQLFDSLGRLV